ncbi:MAG: DUF5677 domain-containing protein [Candidatus Binataceae bacterium]
MVKPKYILDYQLIKERIDRLLQSVPNKLERDWPNSKPPPPFPAFAVVLGTVSTASNTFKTIQFLCSEKSQDWRHRPEMALVVPALARTLLDALYTCIFLFEDLPSRADWYMSSGCRELAEYINRAKRDYGSDAGWTEYFTEAEPGLSNLAKLIGKTQDQLYKARWWPTPPQMKAFTTDPALMAFFIYLDDWYYREFSQISHGTLPGLIHSAGALRDLARGETAKVEQLRGYHFMQVVILLVSLYSEVEAELKIGVAGDLGYLWTMLNEHYPFAREVYEKRRYESRLVV